MEGFKLLLRNVTKKLGTPLSLAETNMLYYIYHDLGMNPDLIEYLTDYCCEKGKGNLKYIKVVAEAWNKKGIISVDEAKKTENIYFMLCFKIMKAMHIAGRNPAPIEIQFCEKWIKEYGFNEEIILEAAERTVNTISKASFTYCNGILTRWHKKNVKTMEDILLLDSAHEEKAGKIKESKNKKNQNIIESDRYNMSELEKALLNQN